MNLLLVVIDSLRADHLGCYGYELDTSPNLDALARQSVVLDQLIAPTIPTMPSFTTLLTGLHPYQHGIVAHGGEARVAPQVVTLAQAAANAGAVSIGIDNLAVQGNGRGSWFSRGFDYYSGYLYQPFSGQSGQLVDRACNFLADLGDQRFFLFLHLWDPHSPYGPPAEYAERHYHPRGDGRERLAAIEELAPEYYKLFLDDFRLQHRDDYDWIVAQYDGEISASDAQVGRLLQCVKAQGLWDDTVVAVLSDHGECFGEGNFWFDHHGLHDANMRLAGIFHVPGAAPGRSNTLISQQDIYGTLCDLCGYDRPAQVDTPSFAPLFQGQAIPGRKEIFAAESSRQASLALRTAEWKLIQPITAGKDGRPLPDFYGNQRSPEPQLYHLPTDPCEARNLAAQKPEQLQTMSRRLEELHSAAVAARGGHDPVKDGLSLGYEEFMERVCRRNPRK